MENVSFRYHSILPFSPEIFSSFHCGGRGKVGGGGEVLRGIAETIRCKGKLEFT